MRHVITAIVNAQQVSGWISGNVQSSMIVAADSFVLRIPFSLITWNTLRIDARITIKADGVTLLDGFIDKRIRQGKAGVIEISGRDRVGRLVDESAPAINFTGLTALEAVRRLATPWFGTVTLTNAKNRRLRRGKGRRVAAGNEPVVTVNVKVPRQGNVHPGETRWALIHEIASRNGLICYSSSDGTELFLGKPNHTQAPQYLFCQAAPGSSTKTTVRDLTITEDAGERFSMYLVAGAGGQGDLNYGRNVIDNRGVAFDNIFNRTDGTGRDFINQKIMFLPERSFSSFADAQRVAELERDRRDYKRHLVSVEVAGFGQYLDSADPTLFATDTVARVVDEELELDDRYMLVECSYSFDRDQADRTNIHLLPTGQEIAL